MKKSVFLSILFLCLVLSIEFVSASPFFSDSVINVVKNEWVNASLVFIILFFFIFVALKRLFSGNSIPPLIIALAFSLGSSLSLVYLYGSFLSSIGAYVLLFLILLGAILVFKIVKKVSFFILLAVILISFYWIFFGRATICMPLGSIPSLGCSIMTLVSWVLIVIYVPVCIITLVSSIIHLFSD